MAYSRSALAATPMSAGSLDPRGPVAEAIADLWWFMLALGVAVFALFAVLLVAGLFRPRGGGGNDDEEGKRVRRWIVGGGVVMPAIVLVAVLGATVSAMRGLPTTPPDDALVVEVVGHQWWYEVRYPEAGVTTENELHIPVGRPVALRLTSADVIHSFWVPELAGKMDMLPDGVNTLVLQADEAGRYRARCAEFCGLQHAHMELLVVAEPQDRFASWMAGQR